MEGVGELSGKYCAALLSTRTKDFRYLLEFLLFFHRFNALYYLWREVDGVKKEEEKQIDNLLRKFNNLQVKQILCRLSTTVDYFKNRRPIQHMRTRTPDDPSQGDEVEGKKWKEKLEHGDPVERLVALGSIVYLVRCNLFHGSKEGSGDDKEIIENSIPALDLFLKESLSMTEKKLLPS